MYFNPSDLGTLGICVNKATLGRVFSINSSTISQESNTDTRVCLFE